MLSLLIGLSAAQLYLIPLTPQRAVPRQAVALGGNAVAQSQQQPFASSSHSSQASPSIAAASAKWALFVAAPIAALGVVGNSLVARRRVAGRAQGPVMNKE